MVDTSSAAGREQAEPANQTEPKQAEPTEQADEQTPPASGGSPASGSPSGGSPITTRRMLGTAGVSVLLVLLVVVLQALIGAGGDQKAEDFESLTTYHVWSLMLAGTVVLALAVGVVSGQWLVQTFHRLSAGPVIVGAVAYLAVVGTAYWLLRSARGGPGAPLAYSSLKLNLAVCVVLLAGTPIVVGLWLGRAYVGRVRGLLPSAGQETNPARGAPVAPGRPDKASLRHRRSEPLERMKAEITQLLLIHSFVRRSLTAVSVVIVAGVLTTGALRNALIDGGIATDKTFPESWLLLYGGFFSVLFATMFLPTLMEWRNVAHRLVDQQFQVPDDGTPDAEWADGRERMEKMLHLDVTVSATLTSALGIFAPFLTGAAAVFVSSLKS